MILRTLAVALVFVAIVVAVVTLIALVGLVMRPVIEFIAADERRAWSTMALMVFIALVIVMEGTDNAN